MLVYDIAYERIKKQYLIPLLNYNVNYNSLGKTSIKDVLVSVHSVTIDVDNSYIMRFDKEELLRAIVGEILRFTLRQLIQEYDVRNCESTSISSNWNIVTHYYNAFFRASLLLRLCHRGNLYFDVSYKRNLEKLISACLGVQISFQNNMYYEIVYLESSDEFVLKLVSANAKTHELLWKETSELIDDILLLASDRSDEKTILKMISRINSDFGCNYPSVLRNAVNYQPAYGLAYIRNQLHPIIGNNVDWTKRLINYGSRVSTEKIDEYAYYMMAYSEYIGWFCKNLLVEYYSMLGRQNGVLSAFKTKTGSDCSWNVTQFSF